MIIFDLADLDIENIILDSDFQLAYKINDRHTVPLFLKLPIVYFNGDDCVEKSNEVYNILITCVSSDLDDVLSPLIQGVEDRIFELIKLYSSSFSHLRYKTTLETKIKNTSQLPWYQHGVMKLEFRQNDVNIFDENNNKIDVLKLLKISDSIGGYITPIIHLKSVWRSDHSFGLLWKTIQLQFMDKLTPLVDCSSETSNNNQNQNQHPPFTESCSEWDEIETSDSDEPNSFTPTDSEE